MKNIAKALLEAQKNIKNALKDEKNTAFSKTLAKPNYATLESVIDAVKEHANNAGIVIVQGSGMDEFGQYVSTTVIHAESGELIASKVYLILDKVTMQGLGSAYTYSRRYSLAAMFCVTQVDDDGNGAHDTTKPDVYKIPFGKYKEWTLEAVGVQDLAKYITYLEKKAKEDNKNIIGIVKEFITNASNYIAQWENNVKNS